MTEDDLKRRTKQFAVRALKLVDALPRTVASRAVGSQLARCGPSVGANYRSACRGRSIAEFSAKLGVVVEEADESAYWLEVIIEAGLLPPRRVEALLSEANEIIRIMVSSHKSACRRRDGASAIQNRKSKTQNGSSHADL